jgi:hypothetical protein
LLFYYLLFPSPQSPHFRHKSNQYSFHCPCPDEIKVL